MGVLNVGATILSRPDDSFLVHPLRAFWYVVNRLTVPPNAFARPLFPRRVMYGNDTYVVERSRDVLGQVGKWGGEVRLVIIGGRNVQEEHYPHISREACPWRLVLVFQSGMHTHAHMYISDRFRVHQTRYRRGASSTRPKPCRQFFRLGAFSVDVPPQPLTSLDRSTPSV